MVQDEISLNTGLLYLSKNVKSMEKIKRTE